jgi:hypothetical protein
MKKKKVALDYHDENLDDLTRHDLNSCQVGTCFVEVMSSYANRFLLQIRNVVRAAHALASQERVVTSYSGWPHVCPIGLFYTKTPILPWAVLAG